VVYASSTSALATGSALVFDGTNLGIGTSSPGYKLSVYSSALDVTGISLQNASTGGHQYVLASAGQNQFYDALAGSFALRDITAGATRLIVDSSGNLGLGVTPSAWGSGITVFQFKNDASLSSHTSGGNLFINSNAYYNGTNWIYSTSTAASQYRQFNGAHNWFNAAAGTAGNAITFTQAMTLDASGYLFVGATSSNGAGANRFQVGQSGGQAQLLAKTSTGHASIYATGTDVYQTYISGGFLAFGEGPSNGSSFTERARIDSSGNLLVGDTSVPDTPRLGSKQSTANLPAIVAYASNASYTGQVLQTRAARNTTNSTFKAFNYYNEGASADKFTVQDSGNCQNTNNSYGGFSDVKLKDNIVDATPKLVDLMQIKVRNYNLKSDPTHKQIGVIAQELEQVFPALVEESRDTDADGNDLGTTTKAVKYSVFVPMLIKAIQEQQTLIETLTTRLTALEGKA
jgi:hypothetical protein